MLLEDLYNAIKDKYNYYVDFDTLYRLGAWEKWHDPLRLQIQHAEETWNK